MNTLKIAGILLLVGGLQGWGFYNYMTPQIDKAGMSLALLPFDTRSQGLLEGC